MLPVFGPLLAGLDFTDQIGSGTPVVFMSWFVLLLAVNLQTSFLTPPFGFTFFCMRGILPAPLDMMHLYRGIIPFVVLQLIGMALFLLFPRLALWLPRAAEFLG